jgi:hypothetical protein
MPVTKETYTANATWTSENAADLLRDAFIDAGLMTDWYDSFTISGTNIVRVLRIQHDSTKTYGTSFYAFNIDSGNIRVHLASGWNPTSSGVPPLSVPTGTQYLDYERLPSNYSSSSFGSSVFSGSSTSNLYLDRYTSADDAKQSWFVFRAGAAISQPFTILHKDTVLHPWLDLNKGMISGYLRVYTGTNNNAGIVNFRVGENLRRCLLVGSALRGTTTSSSAFHDLNYVSNAYLGVGSESNDYFFNFPIAAYSSSNTTGGLVLPVGKNSANPAFTTDYVPICTDLPWSAWTPTRLANDFGVYMHYADNTIQYGNKFIVQSTINEWETISIANNDSVVDGASAAFLARVV